MIYLYRQGIKSWVEKHWIIALASCLVLTILRFVVDIKELFILPDLLVFAAWLMYAIGSKDIVLNNGGGKVSEWYQYGDLSLSHDVL